jgi:hypothetical protein
MLPAAPLVSSSADFSINNAQSTVARTWHHQVTNIISHNRTSVTQYPPNDIHNVTPGTYILSRCDCCPDSRRGEFRLLITQRHIQLLNSAVRTKRSINGKWDPDVITYREIYPIISEGILDSQMNSDNFIRPINIWATCWITQLNWMLLSTTYTYLYRTIMYIAYIIPVAGGRGVGGI